MPSKVGIGIMLQFASSLFFQNRFWLKRSSQKALLYKKFNKTSHFGSLKHYPLQGLTLWEDFLSIIKHPGIAVSPQRTEAASNQWPFKWYRQTNTSNFVPFLSRISMTFLCIEPWSQYIQQPGGQGGQVVCGTSLLLQDILTSLQIVQA